MSQPVTIVVCSNFPSDAVTVLQTVFFAPSGHRFLNFGNDFVQFSYGCYGSTRCGISNRNKTNRFDDN